jgi:hypothetical protein
MRFGNDTASVVPSERDPTVTSQEYYPLKHLTAYDVLIDHWLNSTSCGRNWLGEVES